MIPTDRIDSAPAANASPPPNAWLSLALSAVVFGALMIAGLGVVTLLSDEEIFVLPQLGPLPGALAMLGAIGVWTGVLAVARDRHPGLARAFLAAFGALLAYSLGALLGVLIRGFDLISALGAVGRLYQVGFAWIIGVSALLAAVGFIVLLRWNAPRARWPWERDEQD